MGVVIENWQLVDFPFQILAVTIHRCIHSRLLWRTRNWARLFNNILEGTRMWTAKKTLSYDRILHISSWNLFTFHIYHTKFGTMVGWLRQIKTIWIYYIFSKINPVHFQSDSIVRYFSSNLPRFVHNFHFPFFCCCTNDKKHNGVKNILLSNAFKSNWTHYLQRNKHRQIFAY